MSGLYNMVMGRNPFGPHLNMFLGFVEKAKQNAWLGRYRDTYTNDAGTSIFILHRNYVGAGEEAEACLELIKQHPNYLGNTPDSFDHTYGVWEFSVPEQFIPLVKEIADLSDNTPLMERYVKLIQDFSNGVENEATENMKEAGRKILDPIIKVMEGQSVDEVVKHGDGSVVVKTIKIDKNE